MLIMPLVYPSCKDSWYPYLQRERQGWDQRSQIRDSMHFRKKIEGPLTHVLGLGLPLVYDLIFVGPLDFENSAPPLKQILRA